MWLVAASPLAAALCDAEVDRSHAPLTERPAAFPQPRERLSPAVACKALPLDQMLTLAPRAQKTNPFNALCTQAPVRGSTVRVRGVAPFVPLKGKAAQKY